MRRDSRMVACLLRRNCVAVPGAVREIVAQCSPFRWPHRSAASDFGMRLAAWLGIGMDAEFVDADYTVSDSYQCDGYRLHVYIVAQYLEQHQGKEAVGEFNSVIPRAWWNATTRERELPSDPLEVEEYRVERAPLH